jgi:hypothetical protein
MKAVGVASRIGLQTTWGKLSFGAGALERWLERTGRIYAGRPLPRVTRDDLLATVRPAWRGAIAAARGSAPATGPRTLRMTAV